MKGYLNKAVRGCDGGSLPQEAEAQGHARSWVAGVPLRSGGTAGGRAPREEEAQETRRGHLTVRATMRRVRGLTRHETGC